MLYPTAIGSEPTNPDMDTSDHWQRVMQGHAGANLVPVIASNRMGVEASLHPPLDLPEAPHAGHIRFYGRSFIAGHRGEILVEASRDDDGTIIAHTFDLAQIRRERVLWGIFRDRRPCMYRSLITADGRNPVLL